MFNPFERFQPRFIEGFRKAGKRFLVSQSMKMLRDHFDDETKDYLLFSHYNDISYARIHLSALQNDKYAAIIDLENEKHRNKVLDLLAHDSPYIVYSILIGNNKMVEARLNAKYRDHIRRYVTRNTNWRLGSDKVLKPQLDLAFGELFLILKYGSQQVRFKLEDLEKI